MMLDVRTAFLTKEGAPYVPQNYDRTWRGPVLLRESLAASYNLVAVKVLDYVGPEAMVALARQLGITTFTEADRFGLALTLGGGEVKLLELTAVYAAFANGGRPVEPTTILKVTDSSGQIRYQHQFEPAEAALDPRTAYLISDILSDNLARAGAFGQGSPLRLARPAAAKTGTTTDFRDNWTIGYTPDFVTGVWVGNADNEPMRNVSGITGAAPIWRDIMNAIHQQRPARDFFRPEGLVRQTVCALNGLLPSAGCRYRLDEWFIAGSQPDRADTWHHLAAIDRRTGLLAGPACPPDMVLQRWFVQYPLEAQPWVKQYHINQRPAQYSPHCPAEENLLAVSNDSLTPSPPHPLTPSPLQIISPDQGSTYRLSPAIPPDKQQIRVAVQVGPGVEPQSVQLLIDGRPAAAEPVTAETEIMWPLSPGRHRFAAIAMGTDGRPVRASEVEIIVE